MSASVDRPPIWVGHVVLESDQVVESAGFMRALGMRPVFQGPAMAIFELLNPACKHGWLPSRSGFGVNVMLRLTVVLLALTCGIPVAAGDDIRPVNSWADYREVLKLEGKSAAGIDAEIAGSLLSLRDMDRSAGDDRLGVAAPPCQVINP